MRPFPDAHPEFDLTEEIASRLEAFGITRDRFEIDAHGRIALLPGDMLQVLEIEAQTGFRSPFALGRALDERRRYQHMGILAIQLVLDHQYNPERPGELDALLRHISRSVRELDACYRCIDTTLVMLLPETGTRDSLISCARRIRKALDEKQIAARIGAAATSYRVGARGHEYLGSALAALVEAQHEPESIGFVQV